MHLTPACLQGCEIWVDDRYSNVASWPAGGVGIYDLESNPRVRNRGPVDWVHYHVPRATLAAFADDVGMSRIETLESVHGTVDPDSAPADSGDPAVSERAAGVLSAASSTIFVCCFCAHVAQKYAPSVRNLPSRPRGGLAPWQKRRVIDLFRQRLDGSLGLPTLAGECGLSVSHFARAFRQSFGTTPAPLPCTAARGTSEGDSLGLDPRPR